MVDICGSGCGLAVEYGAILGRSTAHCVEERYQASRSNLVNWCRPPEKSTSHIHHAYACKGLGFERFLRAFRAVTERECRVFGALSKAYTGLMRPHICPKIALINGLSKFVIRLPGQRFMIVRNRPGAYIRQRPLTAVDSTGRCNRLAKSFCRCFVV